MRHRPTDSNGTMAKETGQSTNSRPCFLMSSSLVRKFGECGADDKTATIFENSFSDRQQRVKVGANILAGVTSPEE